MAFDGYAPEIINGRAASESNTSGSSCVGRVVMHTAAGPANNNPRCTSPDNHTLSTCPTSLTQCHTQCLMHLPVLLFL
jgi:hypothetical protein